MDGKSQTNTKRKARDTGLHEGSPIGTRTSLRTRQHTVITDLLRKPETEADGLLTIAQDLSDDIVG
jgi:hypothetical protein